MNFSQFNDSEVFGSLAKKTEEKMNYEDSVKLIQILTDSKLNNINTNQLIEKLLKLHQPKCTNSWKKLFGLIAMILFIIGWFLIPYTTNQDQCLLEMPSELNKLFRQPENCDFCRGIKMVERISNIKPIEFESNFAYSGHPVIITDATKNWTAIEVFSFEFFKDLYTSHRQSTFNCQFFPYKSGFKSLLEAFDIPEERVKFQTGTDPWYFGWSNCQSDIAAILRQYYNRPYFLPELAENAPTDWIFMGGSGLGAHLHIDNVRLPSWQAQLKGSKEWTLAPPPECYYDCNIFKTIVQTGEIIVLDTNKWYHQTNVMPGELSITIGAEYD